MAGYDKNLNGSYWKLINTAYGITRVYKTMTQIYKEYANIVSVDEVLMLQPFSFMHFGYYTYNNGNRYERMNYGYFHESKTYSDNSTRIHDLRFHSGGLDYQYNGYKGMGFSVRRVAK